MNAILEMCICNKHQQTKNGVLAIRQGDVMVGIILFVAINIASVYYSRMPAIIILMIIALLLIIVVLMTVRLSMKHSFKCSIRWSLIRIFAIARWL